MAMNNYIFRVYYDDELDESVSPAKTIEIEAPTLMVGINKALKTIPPHEKKYLFGIQAFVMTDTFDPADDL
mgnify:CR=1 FL=1